MRLSSVARFLPVCPHERSEATMRRERNNYRKRLAGLNRVGRPK
jgi:hypothetical protein